MELLSGHIQLLIASFITPVCRGDPAFFAFVFVFVIMICVAFSASGIDCCNDTDSRFLMTRFCSAEGRSQPTFLQYNMYVCLRLSDSLELRS